MQLQPFSLEDLQIQYKEHKGFYPIVLALQWGAMEKPNYHSQDGLLCILLGDCITMPLREAHTSRVVGHSGVGKTSLNLQRYVYWPNMLMNVIKSIWVCVFCCTTKLANRNLGLYTPLPILSPLCERYPWIFLVHYPRLGRDMTMCWYQPTRQLSIGSRRLRS